MLYARLISPMFFFNFLAHLILLHLTAAVKWGLHIKKLAIVCAGQVVYNLYYNSCPFACDLYKKRPQTYFFTI